MKPLMRIVVLIAALAYAAMPFSGMAMAGMPPMAMAAVEAGGDANHTMHGQGPHDGAQASGHQTAMDAPSGGDCPHPGKTPARDFHCAACLTLPVEPAFRNEGKPPRPVEVAATEHQLISRTAPPLLPPPRA